LLTPQPGVDAGHHKSCAAGLKGAVRFDASAPNASIRFGLTTILNQPHRRYETLVLVGLAVMFAPGR
jgi:hypothetical protein